MLVAKSAALRFRQSGENYTHSLAPRLQTEPAALGFGLVIVLPDGIDMDAEHRITVTVTDNRKNPQKGMNVTVQDDLGGKERGETDGNGKLTVPEAAETVLHRAYIVGYPDGTVRPNGNMTRAEAAAVFARLLAEKNGDHPRGVYSYGCEVFCSLRRWKRRNHEEI